MTFNSVLYVILGMFICSKQCLNIPFGHVEFLFFIDRSFLLVDPF